MITSPVTSKTSKNKRGAGATGPTRDKLLNVAGKIFANRGYRAATVREICVAAKANVAAVNYHFGDKLGLYTEVVHHSARAAELEAIQHALDWSAPPEEILRALIRTRLHSVCRGGRPDWHFQILTHELTQPTPALRHLITKVGRPLFQRLLDLIGNMIALPAEDDKTHLCAISIMGQILTYVFARPLLDGMWPELKMNPEQVDHIADHIADFSLSYIQSFRSKSSANRMNGSARTLGPRTRK